MYNEKIKLMALSTMMNKHVKFWAFASDIIQTNGDHNDLHSLEITISTLVLDELNNQVGSISPQMSPQVYVSYILNNEEKEEVNLSFHHSDVIIDKAILMCNKHGLFAAIHLYHGKNLLFYFVRLINYK